MKHNWEYKRLGDIAPSTPFKGIISSADGKYWCLNLDKIESNTGVVLEYDFVDGTEFGGSVHKFTTDNVLFSKLRPNLNKVIVPEQNGYCTTELVPLHPLNILNRYYLAYYLRSPKYVNYIVGKTGGAKMPRVKMDIFWNSKIPVPPMKVQEQIVAELDKINEIIEDCRELLRNLDTLAQSLFYDFFGDPVTNPKGFKLKKLGEIDEISSAKRVLVQDVVDNGIPFIRGTELACLSKQNSFDPSVFTMFITPEHYERVKSITGVPKPHDLLIPSINADGYIWEINTPEPLYFKDGRVLWVHVNHGVHSSKWLKFALSKIIKEKYANLSRGAVFAELTLVFLRNLDIIVPPLSLQEKFAAQVEQIEAQKKTVEETIANLQVLLDSRMDYWFN